MYKILLLLFVLYFFACTNKRTQSASAGQRIISLAPSITEIVYALDLDDRLVAVTDFCTYPPQVRDKEKVGGLLNPNLEKITSLRPTLILATRSNQQLREKITNPEIQVVLLPEKTVADLYISIDSIAVLNGVQSRARSLISSIRDSLEKYQLKQAQDRPRAILVLGRDMGSSNNVGISGPGAFINELWEEAGGLNAFPDMPGAFSQVNREDLLRRNPNIIIEFKTLESWSDSLLAADRKEWQDLKIDAVKSGNIFVINGISFLVPGPRIYLLAREYHKILQKYHNLKSSG